MSQQPIDVLSDRPRNACVVPKPAGIEVSTIVSAGVSGLAGLVAMAPVLGLARVLGFFSEIAFAELASLVGVGSEVTVGLGMYVVTGVVTLPLLFVALATFLPGRNPREKGVVFAAILWTGFSFAFNTDQTGVALAGFLLLSFVAHLAYGGALGTLFGRLGEVPKYRV